MTSTAENRVRAMRAPVLLALLAWCVAATNPALAQSTSGRDAQKAATQTAKDIRAMTGAKPAQKTVPAGDPCAVLPLADVQKHFPGAKAGERSRRLEEYGITECGWKGAGGQLVLAVQESYNDGSAKGDVQGLAMGITDPLKPQSQRNVRIESFAGLGVDAAAFVEQADAKRGILGDGAILALRRGQHTVWLMSAELPRRERAAALKAFEDLGRVAGQRLQ
jgi:hypothetical protein